MKTGPFRPALRLAVRAILVVDQRLLLVNGWPGGKLHLWCAPGGGVTRGTGLQENLRREVAEETGLDVACGPLALVNEFHDPDSGFHQVELFFRVRLLRGTLTGEHRDPEGIVTERRFFSLSEIADLRVKPDSLPAVAFDAWNAPARYDPLERMVR